MFFDHFSARSLLAKLGRSFICKAPIIWMNLEKSIRNANSKSTFKRIIKQSVISHYQPPCVTLSGVWSDEFLNITTIFWNFRPFSSDRFANLYIYIYIYIYIYGQLFKVGPNFEKNESIHVQMHNLLKKSFQITIFIGFSERVDV